MGWIQTPDRALAALLVAPGGGSDRHPHDTPRPVLQCRVRLTCLDGLTSLKMEHDYKRLLSQLTALESVARVSDLSAVVSDIV